jgi:hypothetical protein
MEELKLSKKSLRKFGLAMSIAFLVVAGILLIRHRQYMIPFFIAASATFIFLTFAIPVLLKPIYIIWMRLGFVLGWVNTRVILFVMFYLIFFPVGLVMKLLRNDPLLRRIDKKTSSYWAKKEDMEFNPLNYERQF